MRYLTLGSVFLLLFFTEMLPAQSQQIVSGQTITGSVHWSGNIRIEGDIVVAPSGRLIIDPGTHILFEPGTDKSHSGKDRRHSELIIKGVLIAKGAINNKIWFTSASQTPRMNDWYGIRLSNPNSTAILEYAVIEYAFNGITIKKSNPLINNCQIQYNFNSGLSFELGSHPKITGNIISENGYAGIICNTGAKPVLTDNMITKNDIGLINFGTAQPNLGNLNKDEQYNIGRNGLFDNLTYNIHNHSINNISAENDSWGEKEDTKIAEKVYDGKDERKFGIVDYQPILGSSINIEQKILLSQNQKPEPTVAASPKVSQKVPSDTQSKFETVPKSITNIKPKTKVEPQSNLASAVPDSIPKKVVVKDTVEVPLSPPVHRLPIVKKSKPSIDYNQVFLDAFLDGGRLILKKSRPIITDPKRGLKMHGKVIVRVIVSRMGNVESATVLRGLNSYYDGLAMEAARKFKFKPGTIKGNPVRFSTSLFFEF